jgi:hypothetical protein
MSPPFLLARGFRADCLLAHIRPGDQASLVGHIGWRVCAWYAVGLWPRYGMAGHSAFPSNACRSIHDILTAQMHSSLPHLFASSHHHTTVCPAIKSIRHSQCMHTLCKYGHRQNLCEAVPVWAAAALTCLRTRHSGDRTLLQATPHWPPHARGLQPCSTFRWMVW